MDEVASGTAITTLVDEGAVPEAAACGLTALTIAVLGLFLGNKIINQSKLSLCGGIVPVQL